MAANWNWNYDYTMAYAETDDPRVAAVIERDNYPETPDGCYYPPTISGCEWRADRRRGYLHTCGCYDEPVDWNVVETALLHFDESVDDLGEGVTLTERYLRVFYGTQVHLVTSSIDRYSWALSLDTKGWREHVGLDEDSPIDNLATEWEAYLDGEVYSIGYAIAEDRTLDTEPFDIGEAEIERVSHGYYGRKWAQEAAMHAYEDFGSPLPDMLNFPTT